MAFAEKPVEHLRTPRGGQHSGIHGSRWGINTDCLCSPGWSHGAWLLTYQTVRLPLQCLHSQFPLLWQERGWEEGSRQNSSGTYIQIPRHSQQLEPAEVYYSMHRIYKSAGGEGSLLLMCVILYMCAGQNPVMVNKELISEHSCPWADSRQRETITLLRILIGLCMTSSSPGRNALFLVVHGFILQKYVYGGEIWDESCENSVCDRYEFAALHKHNVLMMLLSIT